MLSASIHRMVASQHQSLDSLQKPEGRHAGSSRTSTCSHRQARVLLLLLWIGSPRIARSLLFAEGTALRTDKRAHAGVGDRSPQQEEEMSVAGG